MKSSDTEPRRSGGSGKTPLQARRSSVITCRSCDPPKRAYTSRKAAKAVARKIPGGVKMSAYACPGGEGWHLGHLPAVVRHGEAGRGIYDRRYRDVS